jgi:hypothetical protein
MEDHSQSVDPSAVVSMIYRWRSTYESVCTKLRNYVKLHGITDMGPLAPLEKSNSTILAIIIQNLDKLALELGSVDPEPNTTETKKSLVGLIKRLKDGIDTIKSTIDDTSFTINIETKAAQDIFDLQLRTTANDIELLLSRYMALANKRLIDAMQKIIDALAKP